MTEAEFRRLVLEKLQNIELRQNEIYDVVRAIEHSNNANKAELDNHNLKIAKIEGKLKKSAKALIEDVEVNEESSIYGREL